MFLPSAFEIDPEQVEVPEVRATLRAKVSKGVELDVDQQAEWEAFKVPRRMQHAATRGWKWAAQVIEEVESDGEVKSEVVYTGTTLFKTRAQALRRAQRHIRNKELRGGFEKNGTEFVPAKR